MVGPAWDPISAAVNGERYGKRVLAQSRVTSATAFLAQSSYVPPVLEALGMAEVEHNAKNNRMRAL